MEFILAMFENQEEIIVFIVIGLNLLGMFLKNKTKLNNDYIPMVLVGFGVLIGWTIIDRSIFGIIAGVMCAFTSTGVHQGLKTTKCVVTDVVEDVIEKKKPNYDESIEFFKNKETEMNKSDIHDKI